MIGKKKLFLFLFVGLLFFPIFAFAFSIFPDPVADLSTDFSVSGLGIGYYYVIFDPTQTNYCFQHLSTNGENLTGNLTAFSCAGTAGTWTIFELTNDGLGDNYTTLLGSDRFSQLLNFTLTAETTPPPPATSDMYELISGSPDTPASFYLDKSMSYGDIIVSTFLLLFLIIIIIFGIWKLVFPFNFKK